MNHAFLSWSSWNILVARASSPTFLSGCQRKHCAMKKRRRAATSAVCRNRVSRCVRASGESGSEVSSSIALADALLPREAGPAGSDFVLFAALPMVKPRPLLPAAAFALANGCALAPPPASFGGRLPLDCRAPATPAEWAPLASLGTPPLKSKVLRRLVSLCTPPSLAAPRRPSAAPVRPLPADSSPPSAAVVRRFGVSLDLDRGAFGPGASSPAPTHACGVDLERRPPPTGDGGAPVRRDADADTGVPLP
mmetsp:Transcript_41161/g.113489  ORF Transcript_41161/g.113489 Transcript_41161/m.113489 type:complete len:251 (+) Transcript_41161:157-909(+)